MPVPCPVGHLPWPGEGRPKRSCTESTPSDPHAFRDRTVAVTGRPQYRTGGRDQMCSDEGPHHVEEDFDGNGLPWPGGTDGQGSIDPVSRSTTSLATGSPASWSRTPRSATATGSSSSARAPGSSPKPSPVGRRRSSRSNSIRHSRLVSLTGSPRSPRSASGTPMPRASRYPRLHSGWSPTCRFIAPRRCYIACSTIPTAHSRAPI